MNKPNRNYTKDELDLLSGQIQGSKYLDEVQAVLLSEKKTYSDGYIHRVVAGFSYNNEIWDAVKTVLLQRQQKREATKAELRQLVEEEV